MDRRDRHDVASVGVESLHGDRLLPFPRELDLAQELAEREIGRGTGEPEEFAKVREPLAAVRHERGRGGEARLLQEPLQQFVSGQTIPQRGEARQQRRGVIELRALVRHRAECVHERSGPARTRERQQRVIPHADERTAQQSDHRDVV